MLPLPVLVLAAITMIAPDPAPGPAPLPGVDAVLERFVEAVGGARALERLTVRHCRGTIVQDLTWKEPTHEETPFVMEADAGGCVRYAESSAWADLPDTNAADLTIKMRWLMHPRYALAVEQFFPGLAVTGKEVRNGRTVVVLAPADRPFEHYALYFDAETGLLNHIGYHNDVTDWREENGVLVPHRVVFGRKGGHTTWVVEECRSGPAPEQ
jgi:hypothetical protein